MRRHRKVKLSLHHRKPRRENGDNSPQNTVWVTQKKHDAFNILFDGKSVVEIENLLNNVWLSPEYIVTIRRR